jgi:hypothetical protein
MRRRRKAQYIEKICKEKVLRQFLQTLGKALSILIKKIKRYWFSHMEQKYQNSIGL